MVRARYSALVRDVRSLPISETYKLDVRNSIDDIRESKVH